MTDCVHIESPSGAGKGLLLAYIVNFTMEKIDKCLFIANCHYFKGKMNKDIFREKDFIYSPIGIIPEYLINEYVDKGYEIFIILDDIENLSNIKNYYKDLVVRARKDHITMYLVGHYYADLEPKLRKAITFKESVNYVKSLDCLEVEICKMDREHIIDSTTDVIMECSKYLFDVYDTNEKVVVATNSMIESELLRWNKENQIRSKHDLEVILTQFYNKSELVKYVKIYQELLGIS